MSPPTAPATVPVRVALDVGPLVGARTGVGMAVADLVDALAHRADVDVVPYVTSFRAPRTTERRRLPLPAALAHRLWARADVPRVDRWLRGADLVHGTNYVVPPARLPRLVSVYDCWFLRHPTEAHPDVRRAGAVLVRSLRHGAVAHTSSDATADALRDVVPGAEVRTVRLAAVPVDPPPSVPPIAALDGRPFVLAIGTLERRKNLPRLVDAFARVADAHPDAVLVLAGSDGDDSDAVGAAVDALPAATAGRVRLTGRVDGPTRSWLLHHAAVLAYPSLDEGFGYPLLDAMQTGVPIVGSTAGSIPEVAGEAALLVEPTDVDGLAGALDRVLSDDGERQRLVAAGRDRLAHFDRATMVDAMVSLYRDVAGRVVGRATAPSTPRRTR